MAKDKKQSRRFQYEKNKMEEAVKAVQSGAMNAFKASKTFGIPRTTLRKILEGKTTVTQR